LEGILEELKRQSALEGESSQTPGDVVLPLITFFQFLEGLTDLQAIEAVRTRTDWKFALHLSLMPVMLPENALCEVRHKVLHSAASQREFQRLIDRLVLFAPTINNSFRNLNSLEVVSTVCSLNRLRGAQQAMNQALEVLAVRYPQWLRTIALPHWYGRYNPALPRLEAAVLLGGQRFLIEEIASDIHQLLKKVDQAGLPEMTELAEIKVLNELWLRQFQGLEQTATGRLETLDLKECELCFHHGRGRRAQT
jgi:transposase